MSQISLKEYLKKYHKSYINAKIEKNDFCDYLINLKKIYQDIAEAINANATEENLKNIVINFIKNTFYKDRKDIKINTFNKIDYAIKKNDNIEVIMEFKKPQNKAEMITSNDLNRKALHEAIKYFYDEKYNGNYHIKNIIISDGLNYYLFNSSQFQCKSLEKICYDSINGNLFLKNTNEIYKAISEIISRENITFEFVSFNLQILNEYLQDIDLNNISINNNIHNLIYVYKLFHPDFLLNEYSSKDSNQLNKKFYDELLYILGLEEVSENSKKVIKPNSNKTGLINETIYQLEEQKDIVGDEAISIAFELVITWLNRILFLKLFESQLVSFNDDKNFKFITSDKITDFDELNKLFFSILGKKFEDREDKEKTINIPYLNSSLFEKSEMELDYISITALNNNRKLNLYKTSNLKNWSEYKNKTEEKVLKYLLDFLDSYDFSSTANDDLITDENRDIINSAVLGLIFEKLNGYKDGSFYTPGFITEYMAKECIEKCIVDKFNEAFNINTKNILEIKNYIGNIYSKDDADKYNNIINSLRICDPAVGSGHFLVSVLNHIIYLKSYLGILFDEEGNKINNNIDIFDDTLVIFDKNDMPYVYKRKDKSTYQIQKALFKEKRFIIENCLFAVDINPKSVYICQLRLWIELLKNTYYIDNTNEMEVLPNIDINIKPGNSLVSKYPIKVGKAIVQQGSKEQKEYIKQYKQLVAEYKNSGDKNTKKEINKTLKEIKNKLYSVVENDLLIETKEQKELNKQISKLEKLRKKASTFDERNKLTVQIEKLKKNNLKSVLTFGESIDNPIYKNSMEWMLEFPEILGEDGKFQGFDIVIGNPPYGVSIKDNYRKTLEGEYEKVPDYEIYYYFVELSHLLLRNSGILDFIIPNTFLFNTFASNYRKNILKKWQINELLDCSAFSIFDSATVRNAIVCFTKDKSIKIGYRNTNNVKSFIDLLNKKIEYITNDDLLEINNNWSLAFKLDNKILNLINKIRKYPALINFYPEISQGLIAYDKYKGQNEDIIKSRAYHFFSYKEGLKKWLYGEDVNRFCVNWNGKEYIDYCEGIANPRNPKFFKGERLLIREITNPSIYAAVTSEEAYNDPAVIIVLDNSKYNIYYLAAIMNSKLATFYHFNNSPKAGKGAFPKILVKDIKDFPVSFGTTDENNKLIELVKKIQNIKQENISADISNLENIMNNMIYKIYDLTDEEIKIIENSIK